MSAAIDLGGVPPGPGHVAHSTSRRARSGARYAGSWASPPPNEWPSTTGAVSRAAAPTPRYAAAAPVAAGARSGAIAHAGRPGCGAAMGKPVSRKRGGGGPPQRLIVSGRMGQRCGT